MELNPVCEEGIDNRVENDGQNDNIVSELLKSITSTLEINVEQTQSRNIQIGFRKIDDKTELTRRIPFPMSKNWPIYQIKPESLDPCTTKQQSNLSIHTVISHKSSKSIVDCEPNSDYEILFERLYIDENRNSDTSSDYINHDATDSVSSIASSINEFCQKCQLFKDDVVLKCESCNKSFHTSCINLEEFANNIESFYCRKCEIHKDKIIEWKQETPSGEFAKYKKKHYAEIETIIADRIKPNSNGEIRQFRIKWKNYSNRSNSWVDECDMDGCLDTLQRYLRWSGKSLSKIVGFVGASRKNNKNNTKNWVEMNEIIGEFTKLKSKHYANVNIEHSIWFEFGTQDHNYFFKYESHCFTMLYIHDKKMAYISDGENNFINDYKSALAITKTLNITLIPLVYKHQIKVDYCASSAILIGMFSTIL